MDLLTDLTATQNQLREQIISRPLPKNINLLAGCDCAIYNDQILSVFIVFSWPDLSIIETVYDFSPATLPYIPGFLSFREIPSLLKSYAKLKNKPDVIMVDGNGILHPRRLGIATHLGIVLNTPTVGVAKKKLCGTFVPPLTVGTCAPVIHHNQTIGWAYLSKPKVNPVFISPGHMCDLESALNLVKQTLKKHKLPEPTRLADRQTKIYKEELI